jgi:DNA sulfur modification protein DndD
MFLHRLQLHNWKLYGGTHKLEFPEPDGRKTTVLIGARNGFGKTSLLEAIMLCLYDIEGLRLIARADGTGDENRRRVGYRTFLESAWHEGAADAGDSLMSVQLDFKDAESGKRVSVRRAWSFNSTGTLLPDRPVMIEVDGRRLAPGVKDDAVDFYRNQISKLILPANLAPFFLFDGEQVQKLAHRDMAEQVRSGIEGFLGVKLLRTLGQDLDSYSAAKRGEFKGVDPKSLTNLDDTLVAGRARLADLQHSLEQTQKDHKEAEQEVDRHRERLMRIGGGTGQSLARLTEERAGLQKSIDDALQQLASILGGEFSIALTGPFLRQSADKRLDGEQRRAKALTAAEATRGRLAPFLEAFRTAGPTFDPQLTEDQENVLNARVEAAWPSLWEPPDTDCADSFRHESLSERDRARVRQRLDEVARLGEGRIVDLLHRVQQWRHDKLRVERDLASHASFGDTISDATTGLDKASQRLGALEQERMRLEREIRGLDSELGTIGKTRAAEAARLAAAMPVMAKLEMAKAVHALIEPFIGEAVADCVSDIAAHMTEAFKAMAHKSIVESVEISPACEVSLKTRRGQDVRGLDQSAGENQIFAFALISAIARAAQVKFPLIIDTPLARLDKEHRTRVLRHFVDSVGEQVIFLSQDTEIVDGFKTAIGPRVAKTFLIENERPTGRRAGRAVISEHAYF